MNASRLRRRDFAWLALSTAPFAGLGFVKDIFARETAITGIVLLHGKRREPSDLTPLAQSLRREGFTVETPEAPWSAKRLYDRSPQGATEELDTTITRLRLQGLQHVVIGGHSSGAAGAMRYAAAHSVAALVLVAPAPLVEGERFHARVIAQLTQAQALIEAGLGDAPRDFDDFNSIRESLRVRMTPQRFVEYNAPNGPAAMSRAAPSVGPIPILWIAPSDDPSNEAFERLIVPHLPLGSKLTRIVIAGGHMGAPLEAVKPTVDWILRS
jgi:pimeloyl-ACP methyl ester carboxylesterase